MKSFLKPAALALLAWSLAANVSSAQAAETSTNNLAFQKPATASSLEGDEFAATNAVDGDMDTRWSSAFKDDAWLAVDLGAPKKISKVNINWESAYAVAFAVQISTDGKTWTDVYKTDKGEGDKSEIKFEPVTARQVRIQCSKRATEYGYSIYELEVLP
jgi:hypothetical protein